MEPRGILKNKSEAAKTDNLSEIDRQEVIKNTILNSKASAYTDAEVVNNTKDSLTWDEINLYKTEQEKAATMKIDEPKTPYEMGFDPKGEYYQEDDIPGFDLGKGEDFEQVTESLNGSEVLPAENEGGEEEEPEAKPLTAEERHKLFEEKRKQHYSTEAAPLHH